MMLVSLLSYNNVRPATVVATCFLPPHRVKIFTGKGSLVQIDELKLLVSNFGSLLMSSLILSLFEFMLSVTT